MAKLVKLSSIKDMVKSGVATDVSKRDNPPKKDVVLMYSKGTCGHNGCVYRGTDRKMYAVIGNSTNLYKVM